VRPLSAKLLEPTIPELEGKLDREKLLELSGRNREPQIALAQEFGITDYPSPAGGCKLTEEGFCRKLRDLKDHEGLGDRLLVNLLNTGRRFRLPGGSGVILGRDAVENRRLSNLKRDDFIIVQPEAGMIGPTAVIPKLVAESDVALARELVHSYCRGVDPQTREPFKPFQL